MKRFLLIASTVLVSCVANAAYLYWQVNDTDVMEYNKVAPAGYSLGPGSYAMLKSSDDSAIGTTYGADGAVVGGKASINQSYYTEVGDGDGFSYYVELYNADNYLIARSSTISNTDASWENVYTSTLKTSDLSSIPSVSVWHAGSGGFTAVPEPTSGLMMLLGAAMLGLKRKKRSFA